MKKFTYIYKGKQEVELAGFGIVKPEEKIESLTEINHPLFELAEGKKKNK